MSLTYAELSTAIQKYTEVDEASFVANIPNFIKNSETLVNNLVQLPAFRRNVTGFVTDEFPYVTLPSDYLSVFSLAVIDPDTGAYDFLLHKDVNYIREAFPYPATSGKPKTYAQFSSTALLLGPTPDQEYQLELHYYALQPSIVTASTTWLGNNYPSVLLWGALAEAYIYLKGEADMIQSCQGKFQEALGPLKQLADGKNRQDNYRTTQVREQVQ